MRRSAGDSSSAFSLKTNEWEVGSHLPAASDKRVLRKTHHKGFVHGSGILCMSLDPSINEGCTTAGVVLHSTVGLIGLPVVCKIVCHSSLKVEHLLFVRLILLSYATSMQQ